MTEKCIVCNRPYCLHFILITAKQVLTLTSNQESYPLLKLSTMKFLFNTFIFKIGLLSSLKTGAKTRLVVIGKELEYQHYLHSTGLFFELVQKAMISSTKLYKMCVATYNNLNI